MSKNEPTPMDPGAREDSTGVVQKNNQRPCWAIKQLVSEVTDLFPETAYLVEGYNERNVGLEVVFDLVDQDGLGLLLELLGDPAHNIDVRIKSVETDEEKGESRVTFHNRARTQDIRDSFGLDEAWLILAGEDEAGS
jgi:hypothetical protein